MHVVPADVILSVRNVDGRIMVYGSDANEVRIIALKRAFTKERLDQIKINFQLDGGRATIDTTYPPPPEGRLEDRSGTVDYTILVPQSCTLEALELANGEMVIQGMRGPSIKGRVGNGRLLLQDSFSAMNVSVGRGGLDIFYGWWETQPIFLMAEIAVGNLQVGLPSTAALRLKATTVKGEIRNRFSERTAGGGPLRAVETVIGEGPQAEFNLQAADGSIRIEKVN